MTATTTPTTRPAAEPERTEKPKTKLSLRLRRSWQLYVLLIPPTIYALIFLWWPLYGLQMAFKNFSVVKGIEGSPWVGFKYIEQFVTSYQFWPILSNTLILNFYQLIALFPLPVILALLVNTVRSVKYQRVVQMITYAPHFISTVVVVGIIIMLFDPSGGVINQAIATFGGQPVDFLSSGAFRHTYVWSDAWQTLGFSAIIYLAALTGVDPQLHEAAKVDGANLLRRIWHIDLPAVVPVMITLLILNMGNMLNTGFEKVLLMQNPLNQSVSEVIDTYSYRIGFATIPQFSYATAIGLFKSVIGVILLVVANWLARRVAKQSLF